MLTKESIIKLLETDDKAVCRALVVLTRRQTEDEKASEQTRYRNGRGFRPCHAVMGTSMAKQIERKNRLELSPKQIAYWRVRDKTGSMRIGIYAGQLLEEAEEKAKRIAANNAAKPTPAPVVAKPASDEGRDVGNEMERRLVLTEMLEYAIASDSPDVGAINKELTDLDNFMEKIKAKK